MKITAICGKLWSQRLAGAALALAALAGATAAQARGDVFWSVGVQSPGVSLGVANTAPLVVASGPVYYAPPPAVYYAPRPLYQAAPVYVVPSRRGYYGKHYYKHHHNKHRGHGHHGYDRD